MLSNYLSYLFDLVSKRGDAYTCCAACGELPMPVKYRLCTSLTPEWTADAVLLGEWTVDSLRQTLDALDANMRWIQNIYAPADAAGMFPERLRALPENIDEAHLHRLDPLAEYFVVLRSGWRPSTPLCRVDFFTPNGIPLLFVDADGQDRQTHHFVHTATGRTKTLSAIFAKSRDSLELSAPAKYADALTHFAYAERHGILADARILNG